MALRRKLYGLHSRIHSVKVRIHSATVRESSLNETIGSVQVRLKATRKRIDNVNARLGALGREHDRAVVRLDGTRRHLQVRRRLLSGRIRDSYLQGQVSYAQVLLEATSIRDLLSRGVYVRQIVRSDAALIAGVRRDLADIQASKRLLENQMERQHTLAAEFEAEKRRYTADLARERDLLRQTHTVRIQAEEELDESESEAEEMTSRIQRLSAILAMRRQAEEQARADERARLRASRRRMQGATPSEPDVETPRTTWNGEFIRPAVGPVTSPFGYRYHPILHRLRLHSGVDIGASYGSSIRAAGAGTVILAGYAQGYGNCVIVDHGGSTVTLYGHCSQLLVAEGQAVRQGQVIARVGATGMATGPHLHFEVRRNGVPVRPL
jgi:murein DD-endopeptidase MepM/ murein hydrolase activator NlpD